MSRRITILDWGGHALYEKGYVEVPGRTGKEAGHRESMWRCLHNDCDLHIRRGLIDGSDRIVPQRCPNRTVSQ